MPISSGSLVVITVLIYNPSAVPEKTLARAQQVAGAILAQAGVGLLWRNARREDAIPSPSQLPVHLLPGRPSRLHPDAAGFAVIHADASDQSYAGISYPAVVDAASSLDGELSVVLGAAFAHEIGHVLLGSGGHSPSGIMSARLRREELVSAARGELRFNSAEASRIRAAAIRRGP